MSVEKDRFSALEPLLAVMMGEGELVAQLNGYRMSMYNDIEG